MKLHHKLLQLLPIALACAMPSLSAHAQSPADLQQEIAALRAQIKALSDKVEALNASAGASTGSTPTDTVRPQAVPDELSQQVTRLEQKMDLAQEDTIKSGLKGFKVKGVVEAAYLRTTAPDANNLIAGVNTFAARDGNGATAMLELSKEADGGEGVNWLVRWTPGGSNPVHEATVSFPVSGSTRVYGGLIPDFQGYEAAFANQNPLITHNALFDLAGPTSYTGMGMSYAINKDVALKWMVGNIDGGIDDAAVPRTPRTAGLAYRLDWTVSEYASLGLSGAHATAARKFNVMAIDGGYIRGDWLFNGHLNAGTLTAGASNGNDAKWWGLSALAGYKITPRLQLLARADYLNNPDNGGGTYVGKADGLGPKLDDTGTPPDPNVGADLTRVSLGTNYAINPSTQWKTELRMDQSTGSNFVDENGAPTQRKTTLGTSIVVSF